MAADCKHDRVLIVSAKADDRQGYSVPHLVIDKQGYAPFIDGLCGGDYIELTVCLDCGVLTNMKAPMTDDEVLNAFGFDEEEPEIDEETQREWDILDKMGR